MPSANGVQRNGLNRTAGSTSYLILTGTGLAANQLVTVTWSAGNKTWSGALRYANPGGTVGFAVLALAASPSGVPPAEDPAPDDADGKEAAAAAAAGVIVPAALYFCSVAIETSAATSVAIDLYDG